MFHRICLQYLRPIEIDIKVAIYTTHCKVTNDQISLAIGKGTVIIIEQMKGELIVRQLQSVLFVPGIGKKSNRYDKMRKFLIL